jgi:hypothetical protein
MSSRRMPEILSGSWLVAKSVEVLCDVVGVVECSEVNDKGIARRLSAFRPSIGVKNMATGFSVGIEALLT